MPTGTNDAQYVADTFTIPTSQTQFAIDENGDGTPDNGLGKILAFLASSGLNPQTGVDDAISMGQLILLIQETSTDATFQSDSCAGLTMEAGTSATMTAPTSGETFTVSATAMPADYTGAIAAGSFTSQSQLHVTTPIKATFSLPFITGIAPITINLTGATVTVTRDSTGKISAGQLNGVITNTDLQGTLIPGFATVLTQKVQTMEGSATTNMEILSLFDTGGTADPACPTGGEMGKGACKNPDGTCAKAGDMIISTCEVSTSFIQYVLVPDVQMYQNGKWDPSAANTTPDSLSMGIGFTGLPAKF
jgi:hypothetical protein